MFASITPRTPHLLLLHAASLPPTGGPTCTVHGPHRQGDPNSIDLHEGLAALCVDSGRPEEAAACYRRCLDLQAAEENPSKGVPGVTAAAAPVTDDPAVAEAEAAAARKDRWSVALFKCNASLCQWGDWSAEALALRTAVQRRRRRRQGEADGEGQRLGRQRTIREGGRGGGGAQGQPIPPRQRNSSNDNGDLVNSLLLGHDEDGDDTALDSWRPSRDTWQLQRNYGDNDNRVVVGDINFDDILRPALHPFDSLSAPLSIGDCLAVAQQQSRGVLVGAKRDGGGVKARRRMEEEEGVGDVQGGWRQRQRQRRRRRQASSSSSRDDRGRVRLGYVSGDLMGTHPLTHLMQAREAGRGRGGGVFGALV